MQVCCGRSIAVLFYVRKMGLLGYCIKIEVRLKKKKNVLINLDSNTA